MLSLERKVGEVVQVGDGAIIVLEVRDRKVRLGFQFGPTVTLLRAEIAEHHNDATKRVLRVWRESNAEEA